MTAKSLQTSVHENSPMIGSDDTGQYLDGWQLQSKENSKQLEACVPD